MEPRALLNPLMLEVRAPGDGLGVEFLPCALQEVSEVQFFVKIACVLQNKMKIRVNASVPSPTPAGH